MKKRILNTFFVAALVFGATSCKNESENKADIDEAREAAQAGAETAQYEVDTTASMIDWKGRKPGTTHTGTIKISDGTFSANDSIVESGTFTIDIASIEVTDLEGEDRENLENHLKGTVEGKEGDFFNVNEYPDATFEVTGVSEENGETVLSGNLTMKGETKNVSFPVDINQNNDELELTSDYFTIDRTDWKINFGSKSVFDDLGDNFVHDEMELKVTVKANRV